jgi:hypothetical protein
VRLVQRLGSTALAPLGFRYASLAATPHMVCSSPVARTRIGARAMDLDRLSRLCLWRCGAVKINQWEQATTAAEKARGLNSSLPTFAKKRKGGPPVYRVKECRAEVKQNLGEDTRIAGRLLTLGPWMKESFDWKQLWGSSGTFLTALVLLWAGLKQDPIKAACISFGVAILFKCMEAGVGYLWSGGKMNWKIRS